ncbi:hypothetical protein [Actinorhabdospora filicis]|uniref:hypothetical protein n=1 Tax=Actinorhabdospora filicis TaxID=1785913 RepID=UPI0025550E88|nr:hypothetical protein [Actinorhabdospora filicis]
MLDEPTRRRLFRVLCHRWLADRLGELPDWSPVESEDGRLKLPGPKTGDRSGRVIRPRRILATAAPAGWSVMSRRGVLAAGPDRDREALWHREVPELVVEVEFAFTRAGARVEKPVIYARAGVPSRPA